MLGVPHGTLRVPRHSQASPNMGGSASWHPQGAQAPPRRIEQKQHRSRRFRLSFGPAEVIVDLVPHLSLGIDNTATEQTEAHDEGVFGNTNSCTAQRWKSYARTLAKGLDAIFVGGWHKNS